MFRVIIVCVSQIPWLKNIREGIDTCLVSLIVWKENFTHPITIKKEDESCFDNQECLSYACLFLHTALKVINSCLWYLDSGCLRHMTGDKSLFKSLKEKEDGYVTFRDGSHSQVLGKWTIEIPALPLLTNVLYIKGLKANLLSITQIYDEDFLVQFSKKGCVILSEDGVQVLKGLRTTDNCYDVGPIKSNVSCRSAWVNLLELWHQWFGKTTKSSHPKVNVITTSRPLELLYVDLMGHTRTESLGGKRYIMVVVNDFSRYSWVEFLREKSEACEKMGKLCKRL